MSPLEGAQKGGERLCDDLPESESAAPRVRAQRPHRAHRKLERDGHRRFDGGNRGAQCRGLLEIAVRLPARQGKLVFELPSGIRDLAFLCKEPVSGVEQPGLVRFRRSSHVT
jgi:hypothetical protein